jgi:hypothetical protein
MGTPTIMSDQQPPPPVLNCARLVEYAVLDDSVGYSGHTYLFRGGKEVHRVPCIAICEDKVGRVGPVLLFLCDEDWSDVGGSAFATVAEAKDWAERRYPGLSSRWVQAHVSEEEAERYLDESFGDLRCSFCSKRPDQGAEKLLGKDNVWICDRCVDQFYAEMHTDREPTET